ncbi:MAG: hypothetical protein AAFZ63_17510 [Bacteroidota bacterium]
MKSALYNSLPLLLLFGLLINSCTIDNEIYDEAAQMILQNYGGELAYGEGFGAGVGNKGSTYKYLSVELSESPLLNYGISPGLVMTHITAEFAKGAPDDLVEIQVELNSLPSEDGPMDFSLTTALEEAKLINEKEEILHRCIDKIALNDISELTTLFTDQYNEWFANNDGEQVVRGINTMIGDYGGSLFRGYDIMRVDSIPDKDFILISGLMLGTTANANIGVIIDPALSLDHSIVAIRY